MSLYYITPHFAMLDAMKSFNLLWVLNLLNQEIAFVQF